MRLTNYLLLSAGLLASSVMACKCKGNVAATERCCKKYEGSFQVDDCAASSIHDWLMQFDTCCWVNYRVNSDCPWK